MRAKGTRSRAMGTNSSQPVADDRDGLLDVKDRPVEQTSDDVAASSQLLAESQQTRHSSGMPEKKRKKKSKGDAKEEKEKKKSKSRKRKSDASEANGDGVEESWSASHGWNAVNAPSAAVVEDSQPEHVEAAGSEGGAVAHSQDDHFAEVQVPETQLSPETSRKAQKKRKRRSAASQVEEASIISATVEGGEAVETAVAPETPKVSKKKRRRTDGDILVPEKKGESSKTVSKKRKQRHSEGDAPVHAVQHPSHSSEPARIAKGSNATSGANGAMKQGPFDKEEIEVISNAIERFRQEHDLDERSMNELIQNTSYRTSAETDQLKTMIIDMWADITSALPNRPRQSVMKVCRRRWHNFEVRGARWDDVEDAMLARLQEQYPNQWKKISEHIGRSAEDCRDRWRNYVQYGSARAKDAWTEQEEQRLLQGVKDSLKALKEAREEEDPDATVSLAELEQYINWGSVSKVVGTRSRLQCSNKYKRMKHGQIGQRQSASSSHPNEHWRTKKAMNNYAKMLPSDKLAILTTIRENYRTESKISWEIIARQLSGLPWTGTDCRVAFVSMKESIPGLDGQGLADIIDALEEDLRAKYADHPEELYVRSAQNTPVSKKKDTPKKKKKATAKVRSPTLRVSKDYKSTEFIEESDVEDADGDGDVGGEVPESPTTDHVDHDDVDSVLGEE